MMLSAYKRAAAWDVDSCAAMEVITVMEVAQGLLGSTVPLAILPGGSANLMSVELGIPKDLEKAAQIAADQESPTRQVDVGLVGENYFLLRVGIGFDARQLHTPISLKNSSVLSYSVAALKALKDTKTAHYRFTLDSQQIEADGVTCLIDNAGNMRIQKFQPAKDIRVDDDLLDVLLLGSQGFSIWSQVAPQYWARTRELLIDHWQARQIKVS
jgi:diacylglycerol kinase family enzyme